MGKYLNDASIALLTGINRPIYPAVNPSTGEVLKTNFMRVHNLMDYGAKLDGVTDDSAAFQAALNAVIAEGGVIYGNIGVCKIDCPLITNVYGGANPNCQLLIPKVSNPGTAGGIPVTIKIIGETAPNFVDTGLVENHADTWNKGFIIKSTISGSGTIPAVFGTVGDPDVFGAFNFVDVSFENVWIRTNPDATMSAVNMGLAINTSFRNCRADTSVAGVDTVNPIHGTYGFIGGLTDGGTSYPFNDVLAVGFTRGYLFGEHSTGNNIQAMCCQSGFGFQGGANHGSAFGRLGLYWCKYAIEAEVLSAGSHYIDIQQLDIEQKVGGKWFDYTANVLDPNNSLHGKLRFHCVSSYVGVTPSGFTNVGAANLNCESTDYDELKTLGNATTTITMNAFTDKIAKVILNGNKTLSITNATAGKKGTLFLVQDGTGSRTLTLPLGSRLAGGATTVVLSTTANTIDRLRWEHDGTFFYFELQTNFGTQVPPAILDDTTFTAANGWTLTPNGGTSEIVLFNETTQLHIQNVSGYAYAMKVIGFTPGDILRVSVYGVTNVAGQATVAIHSNGFVVGVLNNGDNLFDNINTAGVAGTEFYIETSGNPSDNIYIQRIKIEKIG